MAVTQDAIAIPSSDRSQFRLNLIGGFVAARGGETIRAFHSDKVRALLAYLTLESRRQPVRRDRLVALLWEGYLQESARQSLRTALFDLRQLLAPLDLLTASRQDVRLLTAAPDFWCDVLEVERIWAGLATGRGAGAAGGPQLATLAGLLPGAFMAGFALPDAPAFTAWLDAQRQRYADIAGQVAALGAQPARNVLHNLPRPTTPFFGREAELAALREKLLDPAYPLLTLTGLGGAGKTRLALTAAESVREAFPDGAWFVPLTGVGADASAADASAPRTGPGQTLDHLASAIAAALRLDVAGRASPVQQLLAHVQARHLLLVLDNFEHLVAGRDLVMRLAHAAPRLKLLVTSRQRLGLQMEQVIPVGGLPAPARLPAFDALAGRFAIAEDAAGLRLFVERAGRTAAGFALTPANMADVLAICRAVAGLPLAIELAAALTDRYSCAEILQQLRQGIGALVEASPDRPVRHHSMAAVFDYSWSLLPAAVAESLAGCAIFRGGFTARAAAAVTHVTPDELKQLLDTSHLCRDSAGRYHMHELLRQFAAEKLAQSAACAGIRDRHAQHYLQPLRQSTSIYWHTCPDDVLHELRHELGNIEDAWRWAVQTRQWALVQPAVSGLSHFLERAGLLTTGVTLLSAACQELVAGEPGPAAESAPLRSRLHAWHAHFLIHTGKCDLAAAEAEQALRAAHDAQDAEATAHALLNLGAASYYRGRYQQAQDAWLQGLADSHAPVAVSLRTQLLSSLGRGAFRQGELAEAHRYLTEAIALAQGEGDPVNEAIPRLNLGVVCMNAGDYAGALAHLAAPATAALVGRHELLVAELDNRLALLYLVLGNFGAVPGLLRRVTESAVRSGQRELHVFGLVGRIRLDCAVGDYPAALAAVEAALPTCQTYRPPYPLATVQTQAGHAHQALGELDQAEAFYHAALRTWQTHQFLDRKAEHLAATAGLIEIALARGEPARAAGIVETVATQLGPPFVFRPAHNEPLRIYLACHRAWAAVGDPRAAEILAAAAAILQEQAGGIADRALRRQFLEDVAVNREIRRLAPRPR